MLRDNMPAICANRSHASLDAVIAARLAWMLPAAAPAWIWLMPSASCSTPPVLVPAATVVVPPGEPFGDGAGPGRAGTGRVPARPPLPVALPAARSMPGRVTAAAAPARM